MGKLQPDYITWTLSLNAGGLQKEILRIKNNSKELKDENKLLKESMKELTLQGKYQGKEYQQLEAKLKANNRAIGENNEKIKQCESRLSNVNKSYAQLSKQAKKLQSDLDNTVKALQPEEYARLETELAKTKAAMEQLKPKTEAVKESFFSLSKMKATVVGFFVGIGATVSSFFTNAISNAKEWLNEGINLAANADGVRHAFEKLNRPGLLDDLRKATKNTVNDLELMKAAVQAKDFRIPLEDLGKYLQFAQMKAQQTGQSVEYMTNSIVTGLGRKSLLILDNLGLSAAEINEEMAITGDLMKAVANIVDRQLAKAGENYVSAADKAAQKTAELQNRQMEIGRLLLPIKSEWSSLFHTVKIGFADATVWVLQHKESILTVISIITGLIVVYKAVTLLQKTWNGLLMLGKAINLAYSSIMALQAGNTLRSAAAMRLYNASVTSNNVIVKACTASTYLFAAAKAVLTGNIAKAKVAMHAFNAIVKITPWGMVAAGASLFAGALILLFNRSDIAQKSISELSIKLETAKIRVNNLFEQLKKTNPATEERRGILQKINNLYPGLLANYSLEKAGLEEILEAQKNVTKALVNRIAVQMKGDAEDKIISKSLEGQLFHANTIRNILKKVYDSKTYDLIGNNIDEIINNTEKGYSDLEKYINLFGDKFDKTQKNRMKTSLGVIRILQKKQEDDIQNLNNVYKPYIESLNGVTETTVKKEKDLVAAKKEEIAQAEREIASTPELLKAKNKKIAKLKEELETLEDLGVYKKKKSGDFNSEIDESLAGLDNKHDQELLKIREAKEKEQQTEAQYNKAVLAEDQRYYTERLSVLKKLDKTTARTKLKTLTEIQAKITKSNSKLLEIQRKQDENEVSLLQEQRDKKLSIQDSVYKSVKTKIELDYANQKITQQTRDILLLTLEETNTRERLNILKNYQTEVGKAEIQTGNVKVTAVKEAGQAVLEAELANAQIRAKQQKEIESLLSSFKKEFNLTNLPDETKLQLDVLEASYQARLQIIRDSLKQELITKEQAAAQEKALNEAKSTAELNIVKDAENRKNGILEKYGLAGFQQRYKMQMDALQREKQQGLIETEDYAKAEKQIKLTAWKEAFDYFSGLFGDAITALQDAEIANMEAKYDVEIEAAQGNAEEVERLENEKAEKKLEIEKKYADVQFAVKASQIIANTAMAIMTAMAQLGPIAGPIAAALMGVTGAAQLAAANSERQKVKNMTLNNGSSSSSTSAERVVNPSSGYSEGGYTGDGGRYEVAGAVHRGEYVVPIPEMKNKRVFNMVKVIESIRRQRTVANPLPGYSEGGHVQDQSTNQVNCPELIKAAERLEKASENLGKPARNYVLLSDINDAEEIKYKSEKPFTRGDN